MKILHTADWHIGKKLHKYDLSRDFDLFIDWLCRLLEEQAVDVLLVSGDVFDLANPSSEARNQYYRALMRLRKCKCKIILTGGNHDSPAMLDAPKEVLRELDIHIIGGLPAKLDDVVIPIMDAEGNPELIVAALPFLRDSDLRKAGDGMMYNDRLEAIQQGIQRIFSETASLCCEKFPEVPALAMGHLFAAGIETSDSEREIQIGNLAAFQASWFGNYFNYLALGHIHKPQQVSAAIPVFYSGSPLPLSFSERKDEKRVLLIDTAEGFQPRSINIPVFRKLIKIHGTFERIQEKLNLLTDDRELENLIEVELEEENYDALKIQQLDELVSGFEQRGYYIVKHRASFSNRIKSSSEIFEHGKQLEDLRPKEVFLKLLEQQQYDEQMRSEIVAAFDELLENAEQ